MLLDSLSLTVKFVVLASLLAIEVSVGIPIISVLLLFFFVSTQAPLTQSILLFGTALLVSSVSSLAWSTVAVIFVVAWSILLLAKSGSTLAKERVLLVAAMVSAVLSVLMRISLTFNVILYTMCSVIVAGLLYWFFWRGRSRQRLVEWIARSA